MTDKNVLTLTYGKYTCVLQGFEASFDAIPQIAGYFRDMASRDQTPDVETLTDIAQNAAHRGVTVRETDAGFVLCAVQAEPAESVAISDTPDDRIPDLQDSATPNGASAPDIAGSPQNDAAAASDFFAQSKSIIEGGAGGLSSQTYEEDETAASPAQSQSDTGGEALQLRRIQATLSQRKQALGDETEVQATPDPAPPLRLTQKAAEEGVVDTAEHTADEAWVSNLFSETSAPQDDDADTGIIVPRRPSAKPPTNRVNRAALDAVLKPGVATAEAETAPYADRRAAPGPETGETNRPPLVLRNATQERRQNTDDAAPARHRLPALSERQNKDISRLMAEAEHQMEEPEGATRRSAFTHLRAAVAVRGADDSLDRAHLAETAARAYRSDLAEAVAPRRPGRGDTPQKGAHPLKLLAEQRIDSGAAPSPRPMRDAPVRAASGPGAHPDFADVIDDPAHISLADVLEAAAAYLSFVKGHEQFSRPQLLKQGAQVLPSALRREDGLRAFGQLLRNGKIKRLPGGGFAATSALAAHPVAQITL